MVSITKKHTFLLLGIFFLVIIGVILIYLNLSPSNPSNDTNNSTNFTFDDSDVPLPPSTLDYNKTYMPPKRNCDISSAANIDKKIYLDKKNEFYTYIPGDYDYKL